MKGKNSPVFSLCCTDKLLCLCSGTGFHLAVGRTLTLFAFTFAPSFEVSAWHVLLLLSYVSLGLRLLILTCLQGFPPNRPLPIGNDA